jgi:hypothetical protein
MPSANSVASRRLRRCLAVIVACASTAPAFAGGPLYVVPVNGVMKPLHWIGTVKVYLDQGNLNVGVDCVRDPATYECVLDANGNPVIPVLDQQDGDDLVAATIAQWSGVPTSSFRATIAGRAPVDINGSNVWDYIGKYNGGGIQTIYDADNTVIDALTGGGGYGVLGIASPEIASATDPTQIIEGWQVIGGSFLSATTTDQVSGVVTHEFGHAINLAHSQTNGYYARNEGYPDWGVPDGPEQAGPDQCGKVASFPTAAQIETMYPMINPYPESRGYNSPEMAKVDNPDDMAALSSIYPAANYATTTGTLRGMVVAKDGTSQLTGINVIARRTDQPLTGAMSRVSGDSTQGLLGPDGSFVMTGLVPGASYLVYIDQIADGGFSTPKATLLGPEEYWNAGESADATVDDACASTPISVAAGQTMQIQIAMNGIARAPTFADISYGYGSSASDNGQRITGVYGLQFSPSWLWDKQNGSTYIGGSGYMSKISGNGRVIGGSYGATGNFPDGAPLKEKAALWTKEAGWKVLRSNFEGCWTFHSNVYDLSTDGSAAVGLAWVTCSNVYAFKWTAKTGMKLLPKVSEGAQCDDGWGTYSCEGSARANAMSGSGALVGGWEEIPEAHGFRVGSIWQGNEQMLLRDPAGTNDIDGWVGEVMGVNSAGTIAVGIQAGQHLKDAYKWTPNQGVTSLGRYPGQACYQTWDWETWLPIEKCEDRETLAFSVSDDGKVITGASRLFAANIDDATIYTPKMGWMLLADFLQSQGVLEASRWLIMGAEVAANGKVLVGTAAPLAADYVHAFRLELDQVYVCSGKGRNAKTLRVGFPDAMDQFLAKGATVGLCPGDAPL